MRRALYLPPFDDLADPRLLAELAGEAERAGWDGFFLWDHVLRPDPPRPVADPWIALAAVAAVTQRIRLGPMITPLVRRRPQVVARQIATLDHLSGGRVTVGLGLGVDSGRELSAFGEVTDAAERGELLDEGLELLVALLSGETVDHRGRFFTADGVTLLPPPVQRPRPPIWMAARTMNRRPLRRAARTDGLFPIEVTPAQVGEMLDVIAAERGSLDGFDVVGRMTSGHPQAAWDGIATWWFADAEPGIDAAGVRELIHAR